MSGENMTDDTDKLWNYLASRVRRFEGLEPTPEELEAEKPEGEQLTQSDIEEIFSSVLSGESTFVEPELDGQWWDEVDASDLDQIRISLDRLWQRKKRSDNVRIKRITDACALMVTKDQAGTLDALTALRKAAEADPAGWIHDWFLCRTEAPEGFEKLGKTLIEIVWYQQAQRESDMRALRFDRDQLREELAAVRSSQVRTRSLDTD